MDTPRQQLHRLLDTVPGWGLGGTVQGRGFEELGDWAMLHSAEFGPRIAKIESYGDWARNHNDHAIRENAATLHEFGTQDVGIDSVATTHDGKIIAIQYKGYERTRYPDWPQIATFYTKSISISADEMVLITSADAVSRIARSENKALGYPIEYRTLTWLENAVVEWPDTYADLLASRGTTYVAPKPLILRSDQEQAASAVLRSFRTRAEAQIHVACGAGKTILAAGIAQRLGAEIVFFGVPTIGLLRQTMKKWRRQLGADRLHIVAVTGDDTVGTSKRKRKTDELQYSDSEIAARVIRDPQKLAEWIAVTRATAPADHKILIMSTYRSSDIVVEAQHTHGAPEFDFAFLDEAHYLFARKGDQKIDGELVKSKSDGRPRLKARCRLYGTATPVLATDRVKQLAEQRKFVVESQDDDSVVFGPAAYKLSFGEAIRCGILSDYRVEIFVTDQDRYAEWVRKRAYFRTVKGLLVEAETFAALQAVKRLRSEGAERIITIHTRVEAAEKFAELLREELGIDAACISGSTPAGRREDLLVRMDEKGMVLTNVNCLNEGVDIPNLDAIVFVDPKSSTIDITQSVGRVLRRAAGKDIGRVVVPVLLSSEAHSTGVLTDAEVEQITNGTGSYLRVLNVLKALSEHDDAMRHYINDLVDSLGRRPDQKKPGGNVPADPDEKTRTEDEVDDSRQVIPVPDGAVQVMKNGRVIINADREDSIDLLQELADNIRLAVVRRKKMFHSPLSDHIVEVLVHRAGMTYTAAHNAVQRAEAAHRLAAAEDLAAEEGEQR